MAFSTLFDEIITRFKKLSTPIPRIEVDGLPEMMEDEIRELIGVSVQRT
jgi:uncharacterized protein YbaR (Trm112 family)